MALNKSNNKSTPSSKSGFFPEVTASAGKQTNFLLPVRIKMTPNTTVRPLSDGKKNPAKMMQPVLIKDLLANNNKKERLNTTTLASIQKQKKVQNTQSCYKPKQEGEASSLNRKSCGDNKVRRQLYQTLDSPHKSAAESKENKPKKKITRYTEAAAAKNTAAQNKSGKSLLLQPNSIKNTYVKKSVGTSLKPSAKVPVKNNKVPLGKPLTGILRVTEAENLQKNVIKAENLQKNVTEAENLQKNVIEAENLQKNVTESNYVKTEEELNTDRDRLSPEIDENDKTKSCSNIEENSTTITPTMKRSHHKNVHYKRNRIVTDPIETLCRCTKICKVTNKPEFDFNEVSNLDYYSFLQMRTFIEQSIIDSEIQTTNLTKVLNIVNDIFMNSVVADAISSTIPTGSATTGTDTPPDVIDEVDEKCNVSSTIDNSSDKPNTSNGTKKTLENMNTSDETNNLTDELDKIKVQDEARKICAEDKLPIPIKMLVTEADLTQESKELSSEMLPELARLSTIGEVSCEVDLSNKDENDDTENKEKINNIIENSTSVLLTPTTPITPKILCRGRSRSIDNSCDSQARRQSARLAAKRASTASMDNSDKQDSFTMLENELNVVVNKKPLSQSAPSTPMKPPTTPGIIKQFDKRMQRPLKEYMALKMNGTLLMTPDVKRFQSGLEPTDTPHSRKSMSQKLFMELYDLYAESPERE